MKARKLLPSRDESPAIRIDVLPFDQKMYMVWHEAVGKNCKAFVDAGAQKLPVDDVGTIARDEYEASLACAKRQEILVNADVVECLEMFGLVCEHVEWGANGTPVRRNRTLRPKSAKAGHYV